MAQPGARGRRPLRRAGWGAGVVNLLAVLVIYFAVPISSDRGGGLLLFEVLVTLAGASVAAYIVVRELQAVTREGEHRLTFVRLSLLLEVVLVAFALVYFSLAVTTSGQMVGVETKLDALYYTAVTMATVGYGDVYASGQAARAVATANIAFNVVFLAAVARLVTGRLHRVSVAAPDSTDESGSTADESTQR